MKKMKNNLKFVSIFSLNLKKDANEAAIEAIIEKVEDHTIACELQIQELKTGDIPKKELEIKRAITGVKKAQKAYDTTRFSTTVDEDFVVYISNRNRALSVLEIAESYVLTLKEELTQLKRELKGYELVLKDLTETVES